MRHSEKVWLATVSLALACGAPAVYAAETTGTSTLATQTRTMDSLAPARGETTVSSRISADFATWAGSSANAEALVTGLRNGSEITLTTVDAKGATTSTTFTPPTAKMGHGNVYISLALAKEQLAGVGITQPTAQQLQASLMGGSVTTSDGKTTLDGVLQMRSQNMGWGQIAQSLGFKLGPVISGMKSANAKLSALPASSTATTRTTTDRTTTTPSQGVVTGAGAASTRTARSGQGIVTGAGSAAGSGNAHAYGRGMVTGSGAAVGASGVNAGGNGKALGKAQ
ncbi:MAG: hypothetical protein A3I01_04010 [Betaproteobacteria bacterium RIFCSPLOWO2_02_FULL_65_24]|nr:MAG: hypothetical protein A3I01_04010 [Betaproteobacteria bacterium RIFCSPLOWO2_02_FULL_65_24]